MRCHCRRGLLLFPAWWRSTLLDTQSVTPEVRWMRFAVDNLSVSPITTVTAYLSVSDGETVSGTFTPITTRHHPNYFDILVRRSRSGNQIQDYMHSLYSGHTLTFMGPDYTPSVHLEHDASSYGPVASSSRSELSPSPPPPPPPRWIGMVAMRMGIAPCLQLIRHVLNEPPIRAQGPNEKIMLRLLYFYNREEELLYVGKLNYLASLSLPQHQFQVQYLAAAELHDFPELTGSVVQKYLLPTEASGVSKNEVSLVAAGPVSLVRHLTYEPAASPKPQPGVKDTGMGGSDRVNEDTPGIFIQLGYSPTRITRLVDDS